MTDPAQLLAREPESSASAGRVWLDSFAVTVVACVAYVVFQRPGAYGDGPLYLFNYAIGYQFSTKHFLVYPFLDLADVVRSAAGISLFRSVTSLCALCTAVGLGFVHVAFRRMGMSRPRALLAVGLVATTPVVAFFGVVYELHSVFFAFAGFAFYAMAGYVERGGATRAVWMGMACGLSYLAHATGALLVGVVVVFAAGVRAGRMGSGWSRVWGEIPRGCLAITSSVITIFGSLALLRWFGFVVSVGDAFAFARDWSDGPDGLVRHEGTVYSTVWNEWVVAFFPVSLVWLAAWMRPEARFVQCGLAVCLVVYLGMSYSILDGEIEHGAYVMPLVVPAVWLVSSICRRRTVSLALAAMAVVATVASAPPDRFEGTMRKGAPIRALAADGGFFLIAGSADAWPFIRAVPSAEWYSLFVITAQLPEVAARAEPLLVGAVRERLANGRKVLLTGRARSLLNGNLLSEFHPSGPLVGQMLKRHFVLKSLRLDGFDGHELFPR